MAQNNKRPECVLGFYQVVEQPSGDLCGGVLLTTHLGRPIEFQCTLPVRPNATQQTLYGPTLRPFLIGELIAKALRDRLQMVPDVLFVNQPEALNHQTWDGIPILCSTEAEDAMFQQDYRGDHYWIVSEKKENVERLMKKMTQFVPDSADLQEPIIRVEQALKEAMGQAA
ncbi:MAG: hypothetical protein JKY95_08060 [Planctomycetaceae bacterium]|nr:hypothetical protein [Planctomycetaceae bacterium]